MKMALVGALAAAFILPISGCGGGGGGVDGLSEEDTSAVQEHIYYGTRDRVNIPTLTDANLKYAADSVALAMYRANIDVNQSAGTVSPWLNWGLLSGGGLRNDQNLCASVTDGTPPFPEEPILSQMSSVCTAFLVSPTVIVTAGHCAQDILLNCDNVAFLFNFERLDPIGPGIGVSQVKLKPISTTDLHYCKRLLRTERVDTSVPTTELRDYAVFQLDRPATRPGLHYEEDLDSTFDPLPPFAPNTSVQFVGHQSGQLKKAQETGATMVDTAQRDYFRTNVDDFHGDSGGPGGYATPYGFIATGILDRDWAGAAMEDYVEPFSGAGCNIPSEMPQNPGTAAGGVFTYVHKAFGRLLDVPKSFPGMFAPFDARDTVVVGDVTGDHLDDIVLFVRSTHNAYQAGDVWVSPAVYADNTLSFGPPTRRLTGFCGNPYRECAVADVNGDGKADLVAFYKAFGPTGTEGDVWVAKSTGSGFSQATKWHDNFCRGTQLCRVGDVDGDGRADAVVFDGPTAQVEVALATATSSTFGPSQVWAVDFDCSSGVTSSCEVADVNGDGKADLIRFARINRLLRPLTPTSGVVGLREEALAPGYRPAPLNDLRRMVEAPSTPIDEATRATYLSALDDMTVRRSGGMKTMAAKPPFNSSLSIIGQMIGYFIATAMYDTPVFVRLSTGSVTSGPDDVWHNAGCFPGEQCAVRDMNGDGMADLVAFTGSIVSSRQA